MKQEGIMACCLLYVCLVSVLQLSPLCGASKILLMPFIYRSHITQLATIGSGLIDKGHDVYMLMAPSYPHYDTLALSRIKLIDYKVKDRDIYGMEPEDSEGIFQSMLDITAIQDFRINVEGFIQFCTNPLSDEAMFETLKKLQFDLAVVDVFPNTRCLLILLYRLGVPHVSVTTTYEPWLFRVPALPSFVPFPLAGQFSEKMNFLERLQNTLTLLDWTVLPRVASLDDGLVTKYAPVKPAVSLNYLAGKSLVWLFDTDVVIDYPRPLMPNEINIGGISTKPAVALPKDLAEFLNSATHGAIVVSFGSVDAVPLAIYEKFLAAFIQLEQKVIWRHKFGSPPDVPDNIKMLKWLPQNDIVGHPNCKLLISHGGGNGQFEALYHAVPVITFPIFADQPYNAKRAEYHGVGITMDLRTFMPDQLVRNIHKILGNKSYSENIQKRSKVFHSRTMKPRERAVYWIEHVLLYGGDHLHSHGLDLPWYQYLMLDMLALCVCLCLLGLCICYRMTRLCCQIGRSRGKKKLE